MSILDRLSRVKKVPVSKTVVSRVFDPVLRETVDTEITTVLGNFIHYNTTGSTSVLTDKMRESVSSVVLMNSNINVNEADKLTVNGKLYNVVYIDNVANLDEVISVYLEKVS